MKTLSKPLLIYDGDCSFCNYCIKEFRKITEDKVDYEPYQKVANLYPEIEIKDFKESIKLIDQNGKLYEGAEAAYKTLGENGKYKVLYKMYKKLPGFSLVSELGYKFVAKNRKYFSSGTNLIKENKGAITSALGTIFIFTRKNMSYKIANALFLRGFGIICLLSFISLLPQIKGLIGSDGILPVSPYLAQLKTSFGPKAYNMLPNIFWLESSDGFLIGSCLAGIVLSILAILNIARTASFIGIYLLYLSFTSVGRVFLGYQWDALFLEVGFLSIFLSMFPRSRMINFLLQLILFKLMFSAGVVKLSSGDLNWRGFTALEYHYETQPIPNPVSWYAHQLPGAFQKFSVITMFYIELIAPFLIFFGRRTRNHGIAAILFLQSLIIATGNYCSFNLMAMLLCLPVLDDKSLMGLPKQVLNLAKEKDFKDLSLFNAIKITLIGAVSAVSLPLTVYNVSNRSRTLSLPSPVREPIEDIMRATMPYHINSPYGLFAVMTTERNEIIVQGSDDGVNWKTYGFHWKPGKLNVLPKQVAPHQPRLDWQLWFASLRGVDRAPWFTNFVGKLLQGSPEVLTLIKDNPFPEAPPKYIRAKFYKYEFTNFKEKEQTGNWWKRSQKEDFLKPVTLKRNL